jgi:hypothetical protein
MSEEPAALTAQVNRHVALELLLEGGETESLQVDIVPDAAADFANGFLGESTPLAQAVIGRAAGEQVDYRAGDVVGVRILAVAEGLRGQPQDQTERRQETVRKAVRLSDRTNAIIFASTVNNKWGDYDPGGLKDEDWE